MAEKEIYDYVSDLEADYTTTELTLSPQRVFTETVNKKQTIQEYDSGAIDVVTMSDTAYFNLVIQWTAITKSDAGTILDFYADTAKANGRARTFYYHHPDGHIYTVRFLEPLSRVYEPGNFAGGYLAVSQLKLRVEGRKP